MGRGEGQVSFSCFDESNLKAYLLLRENLYVLEFHQKKFNNIERRLKIV